MASRIFIALLPDGALRESIAALRDQWHWPGRAGPVKTLRLHVTLHFLGEMEPDPLAALTEAVNVPFEPFALRLVVPAIGRMGWRCWSRMLFHPRYSLCMHRSRACCAIWICRWTSGRSARTLRAHVKLAQRANGATPPAAGCDIAWPVDGYALMSSTTSPTSPESAYTVLR